MMKRTKLVYTLVLLLPFLITYESQAQRTCGTDIYHAKCMEDERFAKQFDTAQKVLHANIDFLKKSACNDPILIPVAVHFNGNIDDSDPTCLINKSFQQIEVMNADFGAYNFEIISFLELANACPDTYAAEVLSQGSCIQFYLASKNHPDCQAASDLIGGFAITVGKHSWPNASDCWSGYLNIFVENDLDHLGLAPLFGGLNPNGNGIQIAAGAFGGIGSSCTSGVPLDSNVPFHLGRTGTHEAGHYFGLRHVFEGCGNADQIEDTPDQEESNTGSPLVDFSDCISDAINSCGSQDFFFSFLDYVDDASMWIFTDDQCQVMEQTAMMGAFLSDKGSPIVRSKYQFEFVDINNNPITLPEETKIIFHVNTQTDTLSPVDLFLENSLVYPSPYIPPLQDLKISFYNDTNVTHSLSALDLLAIQKHILNIQPFTNPFQSLAADTNNSGSLSALDLLDVQKVLLAINPAFAGKASYSFYFENCSNCQILTLPAPDGSVQNIKVTVVKNGNVN